LEKRIESFIFLSASALRLRFVSRTSRKSRARWKRAIRGRARWKRGAVAAALRTAHSENSTSVLIPHGARRKRMYRRVTGTFPLPAINQAEKRLLAKHNDELGGPTPFPTLFLNRASPLFPSEIICASLRQKAVKTAARNAGIHSARGFLAMRSIKQRKDCSPNTMTS
jgi:hypothetical protein